MKKHILRWSTVILETSTLKLTSFEHRSVLLFCIIMLEFLVDNIFVFLLEKSSSRQSTFQWVRIVPLFSPTSFCCCCCCCWLWLTSHWAIFQLYSDGTVVQYSKFWPAAGHLTPLAARIFSVPSLPRHGHRDVRRRL